MELFPQKIRTQVPQLHSQEQVSDPIAYVKFYTPADSYVWFATEFSHSDGDTFFGYLISEGEGELGYFSLSYLASKNTPLDKIQETDENGKPGETIFQAGRLPTVQRDEKFTPMPLSQAKAEHEKLREAGESQAGPEQDFVDIVREMIAKAGREYSTEQEVYLLADFALDMTKDEQPMPLEKIRKLRAIREVAADFLLEWCEEVFLKYPQELERIAPSTRLNARTLRVALAKGKKDKKMRPLLIKLAMYYQPPDAILKEFAE